ncbi:outer membrane protein assembly factor BamA [Sphingomonas sp.]|uniref:outer membrane protein assembly factor BamA n=1 Tax=Sphingomonas sp. TaxID=28214 RepID=UPI0025F2B09D|nr:outer membrane protein assembly factor BamA [Sphingomonas sp.]
MLGGAPALAQRNRPVPATSLLSPAPPAPAPLTDGGIIKSIAVSGAQRIEPETVRSYVKLRTGAAYTRESLDQALQDLFATELFADVQIRDENGALTIIIKENPVINRIVFEGNKRIKEDKLSKELKLAPRQIFTRSKVRADIARIIELYRRQGRFAATVEPKMVLLDQNRVDVVYEVTEGPKSKVRQINIIGNAKFSDNELRSEMVTKRSSLSRILSSNTTYDPDKLSYDQGKLRQFYLTNGYADFRVVSAVSELTPDKRDFIITYVVEEGERYKFGDIDVESDIRDFKAETVKSLLPMKKGEWYNAKLVEDTVDNVTKTAGLLGYAFAQIDPQFNRQKDTRTMNITFRVADAPRVYVERIDVNGNTLTQDKVIRREFRLAEGDAFNSFSVKRSEDRIKSLGFFQEKLEIAQSQGSAPDRVILQANVEEKSTGELQLSAGFSSLEKFIINASIKQRNFRGKGQELRASVNYSTYSKSVELGFTEPYLFDKNIALGGDIFRRDFNSFNYTNNGDRNTTYSQLTTGFQLRTGVPLTEFVSAAGRFGVSYDQVTLDRNTYYIDGQCSPLLAGRYLCDAIGNRITSSIGYSLVFDNLNNGIRPTRGQRAVFSQDFAGLGGDVHYLKTRFEATKYWDLGSKFIASAKLEGGYIKSFDSSSDAGVDPVRLTDRFFLGEPQIRGFDIRGVGPRVLRTSYTQDATGKYVPSSDTNNNQTDDALGGRAYYLGRLEVEIPLGSGAKELGLRPSIFMDAGAVFGVRRPNLTTIANTFTTTVNGVSTVGPLTRPTKDSNGNLVYIVPIATGDPNSGLATLCKFGYSTTLAGCPTTGSVNAQSITTLANPFNETFLGDTPRPRVSIGVGVNWNSPFGPFRIDIAKALLKSPGDQTKLFTFNVGTQF